jgi:hypothetical protein
VASWYRWRGTRVLEAVQIVAWEAGALRRAEQGLEGAVARAWGDICLVSISLSRAHLVPYRIVLVLLCVVLVESDDVHDGLGVLFLLLLGDAILLQHALPLFGQALDTVSGGETGNTRNAGDAGSAGAGAGEVEGDVSRTVNSPVSLSMLTWVTCIGFVGVEIVGRRGEPSMLFMKLEKAPFFLPPSDLRFFWWEASASSE